MSPSIAYWLNLNLNDRVLRGMWRVSITCGCISTIPFTWIRLTQVITMPLRSMFIKRWACTCGYVTVATCWLVRYNNIIALHYFILAIICILFLLLILGIQTVNLNFIPVDFWLKIQLCTWWQIVLHDSDEGFPHWLFSYQESHFTQR